ncbi:septation protein SepH, partial [Phytoactinopolyspora endophytica]|uniref:septation protein SepH n=1 Tax=Phytoactinopolyspora endophytica TaxID=1642495 RepID=UPI0013ED6971
MRELRLTAVSEDCAYLILSDGDEQFALRADERLHAAIRGDRARLGQLEIQLESQLRPRDIQARIRAGESVESVAAAATMPLEKVRRFAGPVLAEREHIAERARQAHLKRLAGEGPVRTLESAAADYAASVGAQPDALVWDAWRGEDGRWRVSCRWSPLDGAEAGTGGDDDATALFSFDPSGRSAVPQDATA